MAKNEKMGAKDVTKYVDQVSGGVYTPEGAHSRALERRFSNTNDPDYGVWESVGTGGATQSDVGVRPHDGQIYTPGRNNGDFGNVRG